VYCLRCVCLPWHSTRYQVFLPTPLPRYWKLSD